MKNFLTIVAAVIVAAIVIVILYVICKIVISRFREKYGDKIEEIEEEAVAKDRLERYLRWVKCVTEVKRRYKEGDEIKYPTLGTIRIIKFYEHSSRIDYENNGNSYSTYIPYLINIEGDEVKLMYNPGDRGYDPDYDLLLHRDSNSGSGKRISKVVDLFKEKYPIGSEFVDPEFPNVHIKIKGYSKDPVKRDPNSINIFGDIPFPGRVDFSVDNIDYSTTICNLIYYNDGSFHLIAPYGPEYWNYYEEDERKHYCA